MLLQAEEHWRGDNTFRSYGKEAQSGFGQAVSKAEEDKARSQGASQDMLRNSDLILEGLRSHCLGVYGEEAW